MASNCGMCVQLQHPHLCAYVGPGMRCRDQNNCSNDYVTVDTVHYCSVLRAVFCAHSKKR